MVQEWNNNADYYQGFLTEDLAEVSHLFLNNGQFSGNAGDLMPLTIANVLQLSITIFTSSPNMPLICILPTTTSLVSTSPLCLAYTQDTEGTPGNYQYVVQLEAPVVQEDKKKVKCTCGRKKGSTGIACSTLRCPCFGGKVDCSKTCTCKNCNNKYGKRPPPSTTRRRQFYEEQRHPLRGKPGRQLMEEIGEQSVLGRLSMLEILLLKCIVVYCIVHGIDCSPQNVHHIYCQSFHLACECESIEFPLHPREID